LKPNQVASSYQPKFHFYLRIILNIFVNRQLELEQPHHPAHHPHEDASLDRRGAYVTAYAGACPRFLSFFKPKTKK